MSSFNRIAPFYDFLSRLVFGKRLLNSQLHFLDRLESAEHILFLGGGTGKILNHLMTINPRVKIDFVEPSAKMIALARKNLNPEFSSRINFICAAHNEIPDKRYDAALLFFILDLFSEKNVDEVLRNVCNNLASNGLILFSDFFKPVNKIQKALLSMMYIGFRTLSRIEAKQLPDYDKSFTKFSFRILEEKHFMDGFVRARIYQLDDQF